MGIQWGNVPTIAAGFIAGAVVLAIVGKLMGAV